MIELHVLEDIDRLMAWRGEVLESVFGAAPDAELLAANREFFKKHVGNGSHRAIVAGFDGREAGCGALCLYDEMPSPDNPSGRCGYVMNMYVRPEFRHKGVATAILKRLLQEAGECGKIYLESTEMGRSVYAETGFRDMKNMMKYEG